MGACGILHIFGSQSLEDPMACGASPMLQVHHQLGAETSSGYGKWMVFFITGFTLNQSTSIHIIPFSDVVNVHDWIFRSHRNSGSGLWSRSGCCGSPCKPLLAVRSKDALRQHVDDDHRETVERPLGVCSHADCVIRVRCILK